VNGESLFERHTDSKTWVPCEVDLGRFRGQDIVLRLETHPGPKRDTTCDAAYWGDPVVVTSVRPAQLSRAERNELQARAREAVVAGQATKDVRCFDLEEGRWAAVALGPNGFVDGALAFGGGGQAVVFETFRMRVLDLPVGEWPAG